MTRKQRVSAAVSHEITDTLPYNIELTSELAKRVCQNIKIETKDFHEYVGNHITKISYNIGGNYIKPGYFKDEFGVVWNRSGLDKDIGIVDEILLKEPSLSGYKFPVPPVETIASITEQAVSKDNDTFLFGKIGMTYFERAWSLRGFENLLTDFYLNPDFVQALFEEILDYNLQIIDAALEKDIDGFYFGDDYGQQKGMIMGPVLWRKYIKPGLAQMFERVKKAGKVVALHSCGDISDILDDLIEIGLDIYQTVQPEIYDLTNIKNLYGDRLCFWGAISTQQMLPNLTPKELESKSKEIISTLSQNGGFIIAPTHQVTNDVPLENIMTLIHLCKDQSWRKSI